MNAADRQDRPERPDPNRVIGGRERGPAMGTAIAAALIGLTSVALLVTRAIFGDFEPFGTASNVLLLIASATLGWPALQRARRNRRREAGADAAPADTDAPPASEPQP